HPPVLHVDASGRVVRRIGKGSYPLGIRETWKGDVEAGQLGPGESLVFVSDGLPEARDAEGREFGDARLEALLARRAGGPAAQTVAGIASELLSFLGRKAPEDDVSIAVLRRRPLPVS
ncbi:MAG: PP2C family protein-serine/threonine phosphatase, partial [Deltaproteobacteria bacterium]